MSYENILGILCSFWLAGLLTKIVFDIKAIRKIDRSLYGKKR